MLYIIPRATIPLIQEAINPQGEVIEEIQAAHNEPSSQPPVNVVSDGPELLSVKLSVEEQSKIGFSGIISV